MKGLLNRLSRPAKRAAQQFSLLPSAELPFALEQGADQSSVPNRQLIIDQLQSSCRLQLELLQKTLGLTTAVLLWPGPAAGELSLYAWASETEQLCDGPYRLGSGITGALKEQQQLFLAPLNKQSPAIPYYPNHFLAGSCMVARLGLTSLAHQQQSGPVILCADRLSRNSWSEQEKAIFNLTANQLTTLVDQAREFYLCDRQRFAYLRAFEGLRTLNSSLGLDSVFAAAITAIGKIVPADFIAVTLAEGARFRVAHVRGDDPESLAGRSFPAELGLVGKVLKYARTLPEHADYQGATPVFSEEHKCSGYRSLMIVPLQQEERPVVGALVVAALERKVFSRTCREMLELLASQVAVKIELAQSHEQINRMATVDALTGIANRRAYQRGFEAMLERAGRRGGSLQLILCDIDHFKQINDRHGHPFGDEVLCQVARLFDRVVRSVDLAARTGGEEFAILLEDSDEDGAWKVAERLRKLVEQLELKDRGERVSVSISLGIAAFPQDAASLEKLVSLADQALYRAKDEGRNRTVLCSSLVAHSAPKHS